MSLSLKYIVSLVLPHILFRSNLCVCLCVAHFFVVRVCRWLLCRARVSLASLSYGLSDALQSVNTGSEEPEYDIPNTISRSLYLYTLHRIRYLEEPEYDISIPNTISRSDISTRIRYLEEPEYDISIPLSLYPTPRSSSSERRGRKEPC